MMQRRDGLLFVVSAPSGAGKTSLCRALSESLENLVHSVSYTTRKPRPRETEGRDYFFVTGERFQEMVRAGDFAEWAQVHSNHYGTSRRVLDDIAAEGIDVILDIDTQGAKQIKERYPRAVFIFILPPSLQVLEERLRNRQSDNEDEIQRRMQRARDEIRDYSHYGYLIVNRDFDRALSELRSVVLAERCRMEHVDTAWIDELTR